ALQVPGVRQVMKILARPDIRGGNQEGVAVLADDYWSAQQGRKVLKVSWKHTSAMADFESDKLAAEQAAWLESKDARHIHTIDTGAVDTQWNQAATVVEADYTMPYKAQNPLEPICLTAQIKDGRITYWGGMQVPSWTLEAAKKVAGIDKDNITLNNMVAGGSFGARENKYWLLEVTYLAQQTDRPVQLLNSREDEMRGLYNHAATFHRAKGAVDAQGKLTAFQLRAVSPP